MPRRWYKSSPRLRRLVRRFKNALTFRTLQALHWFIGRFTLEQSLRLADRFGDFVFFAFRRTRRLALEHLELAFGDELTPAAREQIARASFRNLSRCLCELINFDEVRERLDEYVQVEGWEYAEQALAQGRGGIVVTGHIGNWELLAAYFASKGIPVAAIARRIYEPRVNEMIAQFRARNGVQTILRESPSATREILKVLRAKGILAMLIDQDTRVASISVPFFGRMARTPVAAAALAVRRDLPVAAVFAQRRPDGGHRLIVRPLFPQERSADQRHDIAALTRQFNEVLEQQIRRNPAEWVWWHRRWRRPPVAQLDLDFGVEY